MFHITTARPKRSLLATVLGVLMLLFGAVFALALIGNINRFLQIPAEFSSFGGPLGRAAEHYATAHALGAMSFDLIGAVAFSSGAIWFLRRHR